MTFSENANKGRCIGMHRATTSFIFIHQFSVVHSLLINNSSRIIFNMSFAFHDEIPKMNLCQYFAIQIKILPSCTDFFVNYEIIRLFLVVSVFERSNIFKEK